MPFPPCISSTRTNATQHNTPPLPSTLPPQSLLCGPRLFCSLPQRQDPSIFLSGVPGLSWHIPNAAPNASLSRCASSVGVRRFASGAGKCRSPTARLRRDHCHLGQLPHRAGVLCGGDLVSHSEPVVLSVYSSHECAGDGESRVYSDSSSASCGDAGASTGDV